MLLRKLLTLLNLSGCRMTFDDVLQETEICT